METALGDGRPKVRALGGRSKRNIIVKLRLTDLEAIELKRLQQKLGYGESARCFYWLLEHKDAIIEAEEYKNQVKAVIASFVRLLDLGRG